MMSGRPADAARGAPGAPAAHSHPHPHGASPLGQTAAATTAAAAGSGGAAVRSLTTSPFPTEAYDALRQEVRSSFRAWPPAAHPARRLHMEQIERVCATFAILLLCLQGLKFTMPSETVGGIVTHMRAASASLRRYNLPPAPSAISTVSTTFARKPKAPHKQVREVWVWPRACSCIRSFNHRMRPGKGVCLLLGLAPP